MIRIFDFKMDGSDEIVKLASMSHGLARAHVEEGQRLLADKDNVTNEQWNARRDLAITLSMQRAGTEKPDLTEFDIPTLNAMFLFILQKSGLATGDSASGEAKAA